MMTRNQLWICQIMINTRHEKYQKHNDIDYKSRDDKFYNSCDDNTDTGDEDGNQEDHLEKLDIETVAVGEQVMQAFIQAVLLMSIFEQRLSLNVLFHEKRPQNYSEIHLDFLRCCKLQNEFMAEP